VSGDTTGGGPDTTPPTLAAFSLSPDTFDVYADDYVTATFSVYDTGSGIYNAMVDLRSPAGTFVSRLCWAQGSTTPGSTPETISCQLTLPQYGEGPGRWTVVGVSVRDGAGNHRDVTPEELAAAGFDTGVFVKNPIPDYSAPELQNVTIGQTEVFVTDSAGGSVPVAVGAYDGDSGVQSIEVTARALDGSGAYVRCLALGTGSTTYGCNLNIPAGTAAGQWRIAAVVLTDNIGHRREVAEDELIGRWMSPTFTVLR
jgi:hypothetical protein